MDIPFLKNNISLLSLILFVTKHRCLNINIFIYFFQPKRTPLLVQEVQFWVNWDQLERVGEDYGGAVAGEPWRMLMGVWGGENPSRGGASGLLPLPDCRLQHILTDGEH